MAEVRSWDVAVERGLVDLREHFGSIQERLVELLDSLGGEQWRIATMLPGWDVHSIALHLLGGDLGRLSSAWQDRERPEELPFDYLARAIEQGNEEWVHAARRIPPRLTVDFLRITNAQLAEVFGQTDLWAPGTPVVWTGSGPSPAWLDVAREYTERWVHQQQVREAVSAAQLDDRHWLWPVLDTFMLCLPRALAEVRSEPGSALEVEVTGGAGGRWNVARGADRWHIALELSSDPSAKITLSADLAWRWLAGLLPHETLAARVVASGDADVWQPALRAVAVMTSTR